MSPYGIVYFIQKREPPPNHVHMFISNEDKLRNLVPEGPDSIMQSLDEILKRRLLEIDQPRKQIAMSNDDDNDAASTCTKHCTRGIKERGFLVPLDCTMCPDDLVH